MADRFWVGGTGNINDTARWAATSGGTGGASVPTAADNAFFDGLSDRQTAQSVTSITRVGTTATVTCNSHGYTAGNTVTIVGANETAYNGTFTISNVTTNTFDYTVAGSPATPATGTITVARRAAFTVTINATFNCLSFIVGDGVAATALTQTMTLAGSSAWNIYGSLFFPATNFTRTYSGTVSFLATTSGNTITLNGAMLTAGQCDFGVVNAVSGTTNAVWTLGSACTFNTGGQSTNIYAGTITTANYNMSVGVMRRFGTGIATLNLGSSTVTATHSASAWSMDNTTNLTFNAGTSQISVPNGFSTVFNSGLTYYNVTINNSFADGNTFLGSNTFNNVTLTGFLARFEIGTCTFNNLTLTTRATTGSTIGLFLTGNSTVTGTLSIYADNTNPVRRTQIVSGTIGVPRTITAAAASIGDGVDFRDITIAGAVAPLNLSTKSVGDLKGNSGITFPTAKTVYWNLAGSQNWSANGWATTSTGTPAAANFPLAHDTAVFTEAGAAGTVTFDSLWPIGTLTFDDGVSPRASGVTLTFTSGPTFYGNLILSSGVVLAGSAETTFSGRTSQIIISVGKTLTFPVTLDSPGGSLTLADNITLDASRSFTLTRGTLDLSNRVLSAWSLNSNNSNTRAIAFGTSGKIQLTSGGNTNNSFMIINMRSVANFSFSGTSNIELTYSGSAGFRFVEFGTATTDSSEPNALNLTVSAGLDKIVFFAFNQRTAFRNIFFADAFSGSYGGNADNANYGFTAVCFGNLRLSPNMTFSIGSSGGLTEFLFAATSSTQQLTTSGLTLSRPVIKAGAGSLQLMDNLTLADSQSFTHTAGTVLLNGKILTTPVYNVSNTNARTLAFASGELVLTGTGTVWDASTSNGLSVSAGTGVIRITNATVAAKTFAGGGVQTYPEVRIEGGTSTSTIAFTGANRFAKLTNARTVGYTIVFPNAVTTLNAWGLNGTDGNLVTLSRTGGSGQFTIQSGSGGILIAQFVSISNSIFLPSGNGYAVKSTNGGGNNGWVFGPPTFGKFLLFFNP